MPYKILYFDEVSVDIIEAKTWYNAQSKNLGKRFSQDIKTTILRIKERPEVHAIRYKNVRIAHPDVFPYSIHYYMEGNTIVITAIVHNSRKPFSAQKRIN